MSDNPAQDADTVRPFKVTVTVEFEAENVFDAIRTAKAEVERHLWTWKPQITEVQLIDGDERAAVAGQSDD